MAINLLIISDRLSATRTTMALVTVVDHDTPWVDSTHTTICPSTRASRRQPRPMRFSSRGISWRRNTFIAVVSFHSRSDCP